MSVSTFVTMISVEEIITPYVSQQTTPKVKLEYIGSEISRALFERQICTTCGRKAMVVRVAPIAPTKSALVNSAIAISVLRQLSF